MIYAALTFWLLVVVMAALGAHRLLSSLVKPRLLNMLLLPGTLVAQLGHVLGLLITGATVSNTALYNVEQAWEPQTTADPKPRIPVIGPVVIGLLPLMACAAAIIVVTHFLGGAFLRRVPANLVGPGLPASLGGWWQLARDQITLTESFVAAVLGADWSSWRTWLFLYLLTCLTIRTAPFPGTLRGALVAIVILGVATAAATSVFAGAGSRVQAGWSALALAVATALSLLLITLLLRGGVSLVKLFAGRP